MPDQDARRADQREDRPRLGMAVGRRIVVADHDEHDRQREVVVVDAALLAPRAVRRVGREARLHRGDHPLLARDDHEEDVRRHDRPDGGAHVDVGGPAAERAGQLPGKEREEPEHDHARIPPCLPSGERHRRSYTTHETTMLAIPIPTACADGERRHRRVDHHRLGPQPVDDDQERRAREPRGVGLPLEPVQPLREPRRGDRVLLGVVEPAAVDGPELAGDALPRRLRAGLRGLEAVVEPDEVERGADPCDARDDMQPAQQHAEDLDQVGFHHSGALGRGLRVPRLADHRDLDRARVLELALDPAPELLGDVAGPVVRDLLGRDDDPDLPARLDGERLLDALDRHREVLQALEPLDVALHGLGARARGAWPRSCPPGSRGPHRSSRASPPRGAPRPR